MEDYTQKTDSFDETIEHAEKVIDQLDELIDTHAAAPTTAAVPTTQAPTSGLSNGHVSQNISLPKAQLLSFAGELRDWARFNQFFEAMVHRNASLSDIQKLDYLFKALEGDFGVGHLDGQDCFGFVDKTATVGQRLAGTLEALEVADEPLL